MQTLLSSIGGSQTHLIDETNQSEMPGEKVEKMRAALLPSESKVAISKHPGAKTMDITADFKRPYPKNPPGMITARVKESIATKRQI